MSHKRTQPIPQGLYRVAVRSGNTIYTSGMTPRVAGVLQYRGSIGTKDKIKTFRKAVRLATRNALSAAQSKVEENEKLTFVLQLTVYINAKRGFKKHAKIADYASEFLIKELGAQSIGSRAAVGVTSLPSDAPVEVTLVCAVDKRSKRK